MTSRVGLGIFGYMFSGAIRAHRDIGVLSCATALGISSIGDLSY